MAINRRIKPRKNWKIIT